MAVVLCGLLSLPHELLVQISEHSSLDGDIPNLRLVHPVLNCLIGQQYEGYLQEIRSSRNISDHLFDQWLHLYHDKANTKPSIEVKPSFPQYLAFSGSFHILDEILPNSPTLAKSTFHFFILTTALNADTRASIELPSLAFPYAPSPTVSAPAPGLTSFQSLVLPNHFTAFIHRLSLADVEHMIVLISTLTSRLWTRIRSKDSSTSCCNFDSTVHHRHPNFSTEQAILTEIVIWKGPRWVARLLTSHPDSLSPSFHGTSSTRDKDNQSGNFTLLRNAPPSYCAFHGTYEFFGDLLLRHGPWLGTCADAAKVAANGVARLLWRRRNLKAQDEATVSEVTVDASVWRGGAGDM